MRKFLAIVVCKLGRFVGKLVGKGSSMPGKFAPERSCIFTIMKCRYHAREY